MVKDDSDSERGNTLPPLHGLLFPISSKGSFYMHHPTDRITHTTAFVTPVVEHWLEREVERLTKPMNRLVAGRGGGNGNLSAIGILNTVENHEWTI